MDDTSELIANLSESDRARFDEEFAREWVKLSTAYRWLLLGGPVGLHHRYLCNYESATTSRALAWLFFAGIVGFFVGFAMISFGYVLAFICLLVCFIVPFIIGIRFFIDVVSLPGRVSKRNAAIQRDLIGKYLPMQNQTTGELTPVPLARSDVHQRYHREFQGIKLDDAYKWLLTMGAFGVHRDYLGDRAGADEYLALMAVLVWMAPLVLIGPIAVSCSQGIWSPIFAVLYFVVLFYTLVSIVWVAVRLVIDMFNLPSAVAARNVALSQQLLHTLELPTKEPTSDSEIR